MGQNVNEAPLGSRWVLVDIIIEHNMSVMFLEIKLKLDRSCCRLTRIEATRKIERCWCSYRDKQMFKLLKYAICAAVSGHNRLCFRQPLLSLTDFRGS